MNTFKQGKGLVSIEEAKVRIHTEIQPLAEFTEVIQAAEALGRVLAEDVYATEDLPAFRKATMDGYTLKLISGDPSKQNYELIGETVMGSAAALTLTETTAVYVPTGGKLPTEANAVLKVEGSQVIDGQLKVTNLADIGAYWIDKGEDISTGQLALAKGTKLEPMNLGFLSLIGRDQVVVYKQLKLGILTTGDELVGSFEPAPEGKIRDINQAVLKGLAERIGCEVVFTKRVPDQRHLVEAALLEGVATSDLLITSGASSMGKADVMPELLQIHSDKGLIFHGLNIKPGKPVGLATIKGKPVLALPGNPVSSAMTFVVVAETLIAQLTGHASKRVQICGKISATCASQEGKTTYIPVKCVRQGCDWQVNPIFGKSGMISIVAIADGFIALNPGEQLEAGSITEVTLF